MVSDWNSIGELIPHGVAKDKADAARAALLAGVDMDMEGRCYSSSLAKLVQEGAVSRAALDEAVRRVLRVKLRRGLFEKAAPDPEGPAKVLLAEAHRQLAREVAQDSIVLLKNQGGLLPLPPASRSIAVVGPLADDGPNQLGPWSAQGKGEEAVTILAGLRARAGSTVTVLHAKGCDISGNDVAGFADAVAAARDAEKIIAVMGEAQAMSGEAGSRARLDLPGVQQQLLETLVATGKPVVLVLVNGRPLGSVLGGRPRPRDRRSLVPGDHGGGCPGRRPVRGRESEREAPGDLPPKPGSGADLPQRAADGPAHERGVAGRPAMSTSGPTRCSPSATGSATRASSTRDSRSSRAPPPSPAASRSR